MKKNKTIKVETRVGAFECLFESNLPEKGYTVTVPRLKGVVTFGENLKEAKKMAREAIELHCECLLQSGFAKIKIDRRPNRFSKKNYVMVWDMGFKPVVKAARLIPILARIGFRVVRQAGSHAHLGHIFFKQGQKSNRAYA